MVAAGCAFYAFFAIFPALSVVISLYGLTADPAAVEDTFGVLSAILPEQACNILIEQIRRIAESSTDVLGWHLGLSLVLALWSCNAGVQAIFAALNIAYGKHERRSPVQYYASVVTFTMAGIVGGLIMLLGLIHIPLLFAFVGFSKELEVAVRIGRWPFLALLILLLLELLYRYGPSPPNTKRLWVSVGSLFATALCLTATAAFSLYVANFANYSETYGSLGAVIILLFWLYLCFYIALLGAQINVVLKHRKARHVPGGNLASNRDIQAPNPVKKEPLPATKIVPLDHINSG